MNEVRGFYCDVLGLMEGWRPPFKSRGYWLYAGTQPLVHLVEATDSDLTAARSAIDHVALQASGLQETLDRLGDLNIAFKLSHVPVTDHAQVLLRDPVGTGVELTFMADGGVS